MNVDRVLLNEEFNNMLIIKKLKDMSSWIKPASCSSTLSSFACSLNNTSLSNSSKKFDYLA